MHAVYQVNAARIAASEERHYTVWHSDIVPTALKPAALYSSLRCTRHESRYDPMGKYEKLPPAALLESLDPQPTIIDQDELSRAEWLWNRRAIVLSENLSFFFFYLTVLVCLLYLVPDTILFLLLWIVAGASCAAVDRIRLDRWRNQYESSIKRVVNAVSERK